MKPCVSINGRSIGPEHAPYVIAEISGNHLRSINRAREIFSHAKRAGVDAVKIQTYTPDSLAIEVPTDQIEKFPQWKEDWGWQTGDIYNLYKQVHTPQGEFTQALFELGAEFELPVFSTPFGVDDARYLAQTFDPPAYKLGALEINFFPLLEVIAQTGKPIILNTAIATAQEVEKTLNFLQRARCGPVILLTGPKVYHEDAAKNFGLGRLDALHTRYGHSHVLGLSDHFRGGLYNDEVYQGHEFTTAGVALYGASVIEKHFCGVHSGLPSQFKNDDGTIDWAKSDIDGNASITTRQMSNLIAHAQLAHRQRNGETLSPQESSILSTDVQMAAYGYGNKSMGPSQAEIDTNEAGATRFIYAADDLSAGHTLTLNDLHFSRAIHHANPAWSTHTPLPTGVVEQLPGARLSQNIRKGDPIFAEHISSPIELNRPYQGGLFSAQPVRA